MDLFDVVRACIRRWYVLIPLLAVGAGFAYQAYSSVQPVYYSNAVVGLAPPNTRIDISAPGTPAPRNGLLDVGGASLIANMAVFGFSEPTTVARVVEKGGQPYFTARMFPVPLTSPQLPLIMLEATAPTASLATKTVEAAIGEAEQVFRNLQQQAAVPDEMMVRPIVVSQQGPPIAGTPSRTRSSGIILAAGVLIATLVTVLVDITIQRRRQGGGKRSKADVEAEKSRNAREAAPPVTPGPRAS